MNDEDTKKFYTAANASEMAGTLSFLLGKM